MLRKSQEYFNQFYVSQKQNYRKYLHGEKCYKKEFVAITRNSATVTFDNLPKGNYAVFVLHDENKNNKIDK